MDLKNHKSYTDEICEDLIENYYKKIQAKINKSSIETENNKKEYFRRDRYNKASIQKRIHLGSWLTDFQLYDHLSWSSSFKVFLAEKDFRQLGDSAQNLAEEGQKFVNKGAETWNNQVDDVSRLVEDLFDEILNKLPFVLQQDIIPVDITEYEGSLNYLKEYLASKIREFGEESAEFVRSWNLEAYKKITNGINFYKDTVKTGFEILLGNKKELRGGKIASAFKKTARALAYFKFAHPADTEMNFNSFINICDQMLNIGTKEISELGFWGMYFPHYHFDRWPENSSYENPDVLRSPHNRILNRQFDPGVYPYMRDGMEYLAGLFSELDMEWSAKFASNLESCSSWDETAWSEWEISDDVRLAQLGHAFHVVEDYFAHSTFIEQAVKLLMYPESRPNKENFKRILKDTFLSGVADEIEGLGEYIASNKLIAAANLPAAALYAIYGRDKDFTRFQRRLLLFEPARKDEDEYLNSTPTDDKGNPRQDPNVFTGYFDGKDIILSLKRKIEDLFGYKAANHLIGKFAPLKSNQKSPILRRPDTLDLIEIGRADTIERDIRQLFEIIENPDKALEDLKSWPEKKHAELQKKFEKLSTYYRNVGSGRYYDLPEKVVTEILDPFFPDGVPTEIRGNLVQAILVLCSGWKIGGHVISVLSFIELVISIFSGKILISLLVEFIGPETAKLLSKKVWTEIDQSIMEWFGSLRIGSHSLLCKDYMDDFLCDKASELAKATDWYILDTLMRRTSSSTEIEACREGENTLDFCEWIDWLDLLEFFLSHPGGKEIRQFAIYIPVTITHITSERYQDKSLKKRFYHPVMDGIHNLPDPPDMLATLGPFYAKTAIAPDGHIGWDENRHGKFWKMIAQANYGTSIPREINAILKRTGTGYPLQPVKGKGAINYAWHEGTIIKIPFQARAIYPSSVEGFEDRWYKIVLDKDWKAIKDWKKGDIAIIDSKSCICRKLDKRFWYELKPFRHSGIGEVRKQIKGGKKISNKIVDQYLRTASLNR
jgi:hypothetical protein